MKRKLTNINHPLRNNLTKTNSIDFFKDYNPKEPLRDNLLELLKNVRSDIQSSNKNYIFNLYKLKLNKNERLQLNYEFSKLLHETGFLDKETYIDYQTMKVISKSGVTITLYDKPDNILIIPEKIENIPLPRTKSQPTITQAARFFALNFIAEQLGVQIW